MVRGLLWLPLLFLFIWLAWAGWNEYQKLEAYKVWAAQFERSKYDILAALGQQGSQLIWGKPTRSGVIASQTLSLLEVTAIRLQVDGQPVPLDATDVQGRSALLVLERPEGAAQIPFTEPPMAADWGRFLQQHFNLVDAAAQ